MKKLLTLVMFAVFTSACAVTDDTPTVDTMAEVEELALAEPARALPPTSSAVDPQVCVKARNLCTPPCLELVGSAKGACLNECQQEYQDCLAGH